MQTLLTEVADPCTPTYWWSVPRMNRCLLVKKCPASAKDKFIVHSLTAPQATCFMRIFTQFWHLVQIQTKPKQHPGGNSPAKSYLQPTQAAEDACAAKLSQFNNYCCHSLFCVSTHLQLDIGARVNALHLLPCYVLLSLQTNVNVQVHIVVHELGAIKQVSPAAPLHCSSPRAFFRHKPLESRAAQSRACPAWLLSQESSTAQAEMKTRGRAPRPPPESAGRPLAAASRFPRNITRRETDGPPPPYRE